MKLKINGSYYNFFNDIIIGMNLDAVASSFSFSARFNPDNPDHLLIFAPLSYHKVEIFNDNDQLLLTGVVINTSFMSSAEPNLVNISGYSLGGILEDVNIPVRRYPLEFLKLSLRDVSFKLLPIFGLDFVVDPSVKKEMDIIYNKITAEPTENVGGLLAKLAAQRNIVLSHNEKGNIVYFRPNTLAEPKMLFTDNNTISMGLVVNGQGIHSEISVLRQPNIEVPEQGFFETLKNGVSDLLGIGDDEKSTPNSLETFKKSKSILVNTYRPKVFVLRAGGSSSFETMQAVKNQIATEFKNILLTVTLNRYMDLKPGDIVEVENKEIFIYKKTRFMVNEIL